MEGKKPSSEHYFSSKPKSKQRVLTIENTLRGKIYTFVTGSSTFSKKGLDSGTRLLIEEMDIKPTDIVLDLGCGYGAIGIVAANLAANGKSYLVDINERAVELAKKNIELNKVKNAEAVLGNIFEPLGDILFDVILTNPPIRAGREIVLAFIKGSYQHLNPGGSFYLVARTQQGAMTLKVKMAEIFSNSEYIALHGGYRVILSKK